MASTSKAETKVSQKQFSSAFVFACGHSDQSFKSAHSGIPGRVEKIGSRFVFTIHMIAIVWLRRKWSATLQSN